MMRGRPRFDAPAPQEMSLPRYLTLRDVSQWLRVDERTIRRWISARRIPCVRLNGWAIRFDAAQLQLWIEEQRLRDRAGGRSRGRRSMSREGAA